MSGYQVAVLDPSAGKHGWINFLTSSLGWIPLRQPYVKPKLCVRPSIFPTLQKSTKLARARRCFTAGWTGMLSHRTGRAGRGRRALLARPAGRTGNSSHAGIISKCVCLSRSGLRGHCRLACPCPGEAAGWLGTIIYGKNGFSWVHTDSLSRFIARLLSST